MKMIGFDERMITKAVDDAVRQLATAEHFRAGSIVSMPVTYPSGSTVTLEIIEQSGRCFISDRSGAFQEAEIMGASRVFRREAEKIANVAGIRFDGRDMFVAEVPIENVRTAMVIIANCSSDAAKAAALRHTERAEKDATELLFDRLSHVYRARDVQKDVQLSGKRHEWKVGVAVFGAPKTAIFEAVSGQYVSAVGAAAKFMDFANSDNPPSRFGVIRSISDMGDYYGLVAGASTKLLTASTPDATFAQLLEAA